MKAQPGGGDRAGVELPFRSDVEGAGAEGERQAESDDDQRHRADQRRRGDRIPGAERTRTRARRARAPRRIPPARAPARAPRGRRASAPAPTSQPCARTGGLGAGQHQRADRHRGWRPAAAGSGRRGSRPRRGWRAPAPRRGRWSGRAPPRLPTRRGAAWRGSSRWRGCRGRGSGSPPPPPRGRRDSSRATTTRCWFPPLRVAAGASGPGAATAYSSSSVRGPRARLAPIDASVP